MLPRTGVFPVRGPFVNASGRNLAMAGSLGTHQGAILPWPAARERIGMISCHGRQLENASGRYLAIAMRRMIATEVHRRPISDCDAALAAKASAPHPAPKQMLAAWLLPHKCGFAQLGFFWTFMAPRSSSG